jgi:dihydropteroate synthase
MGILNVTPDSFSGDGIFRDVSRAVDRGLEMVSEGADLIDVGGESTRPGASRVSLEEEMARVLPVVERLAASGVPVSVDTSKASVARASVAQGACLINDVSALRGDPAMEEVVAGSEAGVVLMHMQGTPTTMQCAPHYDDVVEEVADHLMRSAQRLEAGGVAPNRVIIDPGIGFGKTLDHNLLLLRHLNRLAACGYPVMIGTSRKSFLGMLTGQAFEARQFGTAATIAAGIAHGASLVRVHDVKEMRDVVRVADAIVRNGRD